MNAVFKILLSGMKIYRYPNCKSIVVNTILTPSELIGILAHGISIYPKLYIYLTAYSLFKAR